MGGPCNCWCLILAERCDRLGWPGAGLAGRACRSGTASQPPRRVRWQTHRTRSAPPSLPHTSPARYSRPPVSRANWLLHRQARNGQPPSLVRPQQACVLCRPSPTGSKSRRDAGGWRFYRTTLSGKQGRLRLPPQAEPAEGPPKDADAVESITRSAPPGAAAPLPRRGAMHLQTCRLRPGRTRTCNLRIRSKPRPVCLVPPWSIAAGRFGFTVRPVTSRPTYDNDRIARGIASRFRIRRGERLRPARR